MQPCKLVKADVSFASAELELEGCSTVVGQQLQIMSAKVAVHLSGFGTM